MKTIALRSMTRMVRSAAVLWCACAVSPAQSPSQIRGWGDFAFDTRGRDGTFVAVTAAVYTTAVLSTGGHIYVNGSNTYVPSVVPPLPAGRRYVAMDVNNGGGGAVTDDGKIVVWGGSWNPSLPPTYTGSIYPPAPSPPFGMTYTDVAVGGSYGLGRLSDGSVIGWGYNQYGQCDVPAFPPGVIALHMRCFAYTSYIFLSDGSLLVFGDTSAQYLPPPLPAGVHYTDLCRGKFHNLALRSDGLIEAWGDNSNGECNVPPLPAGVVYTAIGAGWAHSNAARSDGVIVSWGSNSSVPPQLAPGVQCTQIACGSHHAVGLLSNGRIATWGRDDFYQAYVPALLDEAPGTRFTDVAQGDYHSLAVTSAGKVVGWGWDQYGQATPPSWFANYTFTRVTASVWHSAAMTTAGEVFAWGDNNNGRASIPPLPAGVHYVDFAASAQATVLVRSDGNVTGCGPGFSAAAVPPLPPGVTYVACDAHETGFALLRSDGQVWWSYPYPIPPLPPGVINTAVAYGRGMRLLLRSDGTAWAAATITHIGDRVLPNLPWGVSYVEVDAGYDNGAARRSDGLVETCGYVTNSLSAVPPLDPGTSYVQIDSGYHVIAARVGPTSTYVSFGHGCRGSMHATRQVPRDTPRIGATLDVRFFDVPEDLLVLAFGWRRSPQIDLGIIGMPGCKLQVDPVAYAAVGGQNHVAMWSLPIPNDPTLVGVRFLSQALVFDQNAGNAFGAVLSDAAVGVIGHW